MLVTAPDQGAAKVGAVHQGRTPACGTPAADTALNPPVLPGLPAANPALALLRLPTISNRASLFQNAWLGQTIDRMPLRSTLHDAIKVQHYLGQLSAERAEWLAAHKNHPLLFWAGVEQGFNRTVKDEAGQVEHLIRDAGGFINTYALKHFADTYPMRDLACFACNWMGEAPELVNESLVHELLNLKRRLADDQSVAVDTSVLSSALEDTLENISKDLTNRIQAAQPAGEDDISTLSFTSTADPQGGLIVGTDFMVGVDLDIDDDLLNGDTWAGVKLALGLINRHLHPLETPNEIETFDAMMLDEAEDDLVAIATYLCDNDLEPTEQNVEDALIETDSWCIDCYQTWEHMVDQKAFHEETEERWRPVELTTPEALASVIERLTEPTSEAEKQLHDWLREVHRSVCRVMETHTATGSDHLVNGIAAIYQPVFLTKETTVLESLEMTHESLMSGEPEEWTPIPWNTHPRRLRELADRLGLGAALLRKLTTISTAPS